jgi:adenosylcobyric acid synthase
VQPQNGCFQTLSGCALTGYEIHMGRTTISGQAAQPFAVFSDGSPDGCVCGHVLGSYLHGLFDAGLGRALAAQLLLRKGLSGDIAETESHDDYKNKQYDTLAAALRQSLDMDAVYRILGI